MAQGGLGQDEALEQVRWLVECGMIDFVEISGGNAEQKTSGLHSLSQPLPAGTDDMLIDLQHHSERSPWKKPQRYPPRPASERHISRNLQSESKA